MSVSDATYEQLVLEDREGHWELHCGRLVEKPGVTARHAEIIDLLYTALRRQLSTAEYSIRAENGRLHSPESTYFEPELAVVPKRLVRDFMRDHPERLEVYDAPMLLVVEVWSPGTGAYDINTKIPVYQRRGDLEIWRLHPLES